MLKIKRNSPNDPTPRRAQLSGEEIQNMVRMRAYEIFRNRGGRPGDHMSDWLKAEKQVKDELRLR